MTEKITIYMPVYNGADYIESAIDSILNQTYRSFTLLISDNKSTDNTVEIVKKYLCDARVKLVVNDENVGMLNNGNRCLNMIDTKYFTGLCHDDIFFAPDAIEKAVNVLENHNDVAVVYCGTQMIDSSGNPIMIRKNSYTGIVDSDFVARKSILNGRNLYGAVLLSRSSAIADFKYSSDYYHTSDIDFSIWAGRNKRVYYLPENLIGLRFHGSNYTARKFDSIDKEFMGLADKYDIKLSFGEKGLMRINHYLNYLKKRVFYIYLDRIRK